MVHYAIRINEETLPLVIKLDKEVENLMLDSDSHYLVILIGMHGDMTSEIYSKEEFFRAYRHADKIPVFQILRA